MRRYVSLLFVLAGAGAALFLSGRSQELESPGSLNDPTLLITFGLNADSDERWDGSIQVTEGEILALEGRHFSDGAAVIKNSSWKCRVRRDELPPFANIHYTEMQPGSTPKVLFHPVGIYVTVRQNGKAAVSVTTSQGDFQFAMSDIGFEPKLFLSDRVTVARIPSIEKLTGDDFEDDEPALTALPDGTTAVAWVAYQNRADRVLMRTKRDGSWSSPEEITQAPGDVFRCGLASDRQGNLWAFWSQRENQQWQIWARQKKNGIWQSPFRISERGSNIFPRVASRDGRLFVVWQSIRGGQSDIYLKSYFDSWSREIQISESAANDWEPALAAGAGGAAYIAWDSYDAGNYDIHVRALQNGSLSPLYKLTSSPRFQAHASVAVDSQNRPWVAWNESGVNWGKDQGFVIVTPLSVPLHQTRWIRVATLQGKDWVEPEQPLSEALPEAFRQNSEHPQILFDRAGALNLVFRHWTRRESRRIGSPLVWENYWMRLGADQWSAPAPLPHSGGSIEKHPAMCSDAEGNIWAAWMSDNRPFPTMVPKNAEVYVGRIAPATGGANPKANPFRPFSDEFSEAIPVHPNEAADVRAIRSYTIRAGDKRYKIYRGDLHRHSDVSADFKYDGSLIEIYRYALDVAGFDYIAPTDHQTGFDQEFTWWQNQKLVDVFLVPDRFVPLFAYERSLRFPNGHRNIVFAQRGVRTLPIPRDEAQGLVGAEKLYEYLRENQGISMPHSMATDQGTDWRDNDPEVEPLVEIYQGYRNSYEYEGAPRAADSLNLHAQKSGWQPQGFWWNALARGYKLGVQASSDHWSTHISYACIIGESLTREALVDAMRKRHAYAATDNIILDFRAEKDETTYLMGDVVASPTAPKLLVKSVGTAVIQQIDLVKNGKFVYTSRPLTREANFQFLDTDFQPGKNYYYVRVLQQDGQLAWSSPIWVE